MNTLTESSTLNISVDNEFNADSIQQPETKFKKLWIDTKSLNVPNVLDPDDTLMKKFQNALREHLVRVDNKLSSEILELVRILLFFPYLKRIHQSKYNTHINKTLIYYIYICRIINCKYILQEAKIKSIEKEHEAESLQLYYAQQEIAQQQTTIEKYQSMITNVILLREEKNMRIKEARDIHKVAHTKLLDEKTKEENLAHELEQLTALQAQFSKWQKELENSLAISKQVSRKDKTIQRDLIIQKQQKDFIIFRLMEEIWKIKTEIANLDIQLQLKNKEKIEISQMIADVNADLEALHKQHKNLCNAWNSVVLNITKRNKVYEQLNTEREYVIFFVVFKDLNV